VDADESFTYDTVGNRLTSADTSDTWSYNLNNELQGFDTVWYDYDVNGNMIQKTVAGVVTKFFYNLEDRMERVEDGVGNVIATYYYDPFGRRLWKEVSGVRTYFHYADEGLMAELDSAGNVITKSYGYKPGSTWITDPLFMKVGSDYYFYQNDHLGTPQKMTAVNGAVVWSAKYSSFGEATVDPSSTITNNLRFPGQYFDEETGNHYNWTRYYDSKTGRYLSEDPIGINGGANVYGYVYSNPLNFSDPFGLFCCNKDGSVNTNDSCCKDRSPSEKAAAWAQYQYEQNSKNYTFNASTCGGKGQWKCNCFVRDALQNGAGLRGKKQVPKHYIGGKKQWTFAKANELADITKNTDVLGTGDGSTGNIVAWANPKGSGHTAIVGCDKKIYSAGENEIYRWNRTTLFSAQQIARYVSTGRSKVYRNLLSQ
jgi:RHS repeat-associated protein